MPYFSANCFTERYSILLYRQNKNHFSAAKIIFFADTGKFFAKKQNLFPFYLLFLNHSDKDK